MKEKYFLNRIRGIREIRVGLLFLNHNAKIQHFSFPTHRCSMLLHDTQRLSLINIRGLPNGRKYYPSHNFSHKDAIHKYDT